MPARGHRLFHRGAGGRRRWRSRRRRDRERGDRLRDHHRRPDRPVRAVRRRRGRAGHPVPGVLGQGQRRRRDLRPRRHAPGAGPRVRPAEGRLALPEHGPGRRRPAAGARRADQCRRPARWPSRTASTSAAWAGPARRWSTRTTSCPAPATASRAPTRSTTSSTSSGSPRATRSASSTSSATTAATPSPAPQYAAEERGLTIVPQEITPAITDLSAQASALVQEDVSAVVLGAAPGAAGLAGRSPVLPGCRRPDHRHEPDLQPRAAEHACRRRAARQRVQHHQRRPVRVRRAGRPGGERALRRGRPGRRHRLGGAAGLCPGRAAAAPRSRGPATPAT